MAILTPLLLLLKNSRSLRRSLTPGLVSSLILSLMFIVIRKLRPICHYLPSDENNGCSFDWRETEMFVFFMCIMVLKNRAAVSAEQMITTTLMYAKILSVALFYRLDIKLCFIYSVLCLVRLWFFPENFDEGPGEITFFSDKTLKDVLVQEPNVTWVIFFHTTWSPPCRAASPAFSAQSRKYATDYLKFGKIDVGKYYEAAKEYGVNTSTLSTQLPTVIVFEDGKPSNWRPMIGPRQKFIKYVFSEENMERDFCFEKLMKDSLVKCKKFKKSNKKKD